MHTRMNVMNKNSLYLQLVCTVHYIYMLSKKNGDFVFSEPDGVKVNVFFSC